MSTLLVLAACTSIIETASAANTRVRASIDPTGVSTTEVHFGMIAVGASSPPTLVEVINDGLVPLFNVRWRIGGTQCAAFLTPAPICFAERDSYQATGDCPESLDPGDSCTISIAFKPVQSGQLIAALVLDFEADSYINRDWGALLVGSGTPLTSFRPGLVPVVEYYHAELDHYFMTVTPGEMAVLDSGTLPGWRRTGSFFWAYPSQPDAPTSAHPVCRYYGRPEAGLNSHFYSVLAMECQAVQVAFPHAWILESADYFRAILPTTEGGCSATPALRLFRLYNGRADANHRFTMSEAIRNHMVYSRGWIAEGNGSYPIAMCVPL